MWSLMILRGAEGFFFQLNLLFLSSRFMFFSPFKCIIGYESFLSSFPFHLQIDMLEYTQGQSVFVVFSSPE